MKVKYLHTMVRVKDLDASLAFWKLLGLEETRRIENEGGRFTLIFLAPPGQSECPVELTYNWDGDEGLPSDGRHFGHLAYAVENIYDMCRHLQDNGATLPPTLLAQRSFGGGVGIQGRGALIPDGADADALGHVVVMNYSTNTIKVYDGEIDADFAEPAGAMYDALEGEMAWLDGDWADARALGEAALARL